MSREAFEKWLKSEKIPRPYWEVLKAFTRGQLETFALNAYQACEAHMQAEIIKLHAMIKAKNDLLSEIKDVTLCTLTEKIAQQALALTPENYNVKDGE